MGYLDAGMQLACLTLFSYSCIVLRMIRCYRICLCDCYVLNDRALLPSPTVLCSQLLVCAFHPFPYLETLTDEHFSNKVSL